MKDLIERYGWLGPHIPMNAKDAGKKKDALMEDDDYVAEHKLDGARYYAVNGRVFSRRLSVRDNLPVEKTKNVPHLAEALSKLPDGTILDGEIYYPGKTSNEVTRILGALPSKAIARQVGNPIRYAAFDVTHVGGKSIMHKPWHERRRLLEQIYDEHLKDSAHVDLSKVYHGKEAKANLLKTVFDRGEEGIMLKNKHAVYQPDMRPEHHWYKIKKQITYDAVIMGFEAGKGKYADMVGAVVYGMYDKKGGKLKVIGTTSGMTDKLRLMMTKTPNSYIGKVIELKAMEQTPDGSFRHPQFVRFNNEKSPSMCIMGEF